MKKIKLGKYEHYKKKQYEVINTAIQTETREELVIYKALYKLDGFDQNTLWARPKDMFLETVIVDGKEVPRFKYIG